MRPTQRGEGVKEDPRHTTGLAEAEYQRQVELTRRLRQAYPLGSPERGHPVELIGRKCSGSPETFDSRPSTNVVHDALRSLAQDG